MPGQEMEELCLKGRPAAAGAPVGRKRVLAIVEDEAGIEALTEALGENGLSDAWRTLDREVAGVQDGAQYTRGAWQAGKTCVLACARVMTRRLLHLAALALATGCASAPPPSPPPVIAHSYDVKIANVLRLEDYRILDDAQSHPPAPPPAVDRRGRPLPSAGPPPALDLITLLGDTDPRVRRRAALAIGRVGLPSGAAPLIARLQDPDADVRAMVAFALGLIGDAAAVEPLLTALGDPNALVKGRAAHALGLIGPDKAASAAPAIGTMVRALVESGAIATPPGDDAPAMSAEADAVRRGLIALMTLRSYDGIATAVLDEQGRPRSGWWPIAAALSRVADDRAVPALTALVSSPSPYTASYALRGLGERKAVAAVPTLLPLLEVAREVHPQVRVSAVRAAGQLRDRRAIAPLLAMLRGKAVPQGLELEILAALGALEADEAEPDLIDRLTVRSPFVRAAALRALSRVDVLSFTTVLSGLDPDPDWRVRASLADALTVLAPENATPMLERLLADKDARVLPAVLRAWSTLKLPGLETHLAAALTRDDIGVRSEAASIAGAQKIAALRQPLVAAYQRARSDSSDDARWAALTALAALDPAAARAPMEETLADKDWALRLRAARWLVAQDASSDALTRIRPAPVTAAPDVYTSAIQPPYSPQIYLETAKGTVQLQLDVLDATLTTVNFMALARKGYFDGLQIHRVVPAFVVQDGDPRGDGSGGPGYSIRDELNDRPYLRGTVGMALSGPDTGGSQWFVTHAPQPHLEGRYTVFGQVVNGMEVVDALEVGDTITRIRVWDGVTAPQ
jgi:HEAT repeat protein/cyclophilin family peptidyl-prolyl cis-trans isomerase